MTENEIAIKGLKDARKRLAKGAHWIKGSLYAGEKGCCIAGALREVCQEYNPGNRPPVRQLIKDTILRFANKLFPNMQFISLPHFNDYPETKFEHIDKVLQQSIWYLGG